MPTCTQTKAETRDNGKIEAFVQGILAAPSFADSFKQIYCRTTNGKFRRIGYFKQNGELVIINKRYFAKNKDYYITKNSFFVPNNRGTDYLFSFDNVVFDLDAHDKNNYAELDYEINKLLWLLDNDYQGKFPEVNVVRSGRGVHLWLRLESFSAKLKFIYDWICRYFCDKLSEIIKENGIKLTVDYTASTDASRIMRLPYTYNQERRGYLAQYEHRTDKLYTFQDLLAEFPIEQEHKSKVHVAAAQSDEETARYIGLNRKRLNYIQQLISAYGGECSGRRDKILFLAYNAAVQLMERSEARELIEELNESFTAPLRATELETIVKYIDDKGYLRLKNETFLEWLELSTEERMQYIGSSTRDLQRRAAKKKKADRNRHIAELRAAGKSIRAIATEIGCSDKTVQTVLKNAVKNTDQDSKHKATSETDTVQTENEAVQAETTSTVQTAELPKRSRRKESTGSNGVRAIQPSRATPPS